MYSSQESIRKMEHVVSPGRFHGIWSKMYIESKKEDKGQESIQSSTTHYQGYQWESDNVTVRHHKREPRGQPFLSR